MAKNMQQQLLGVSSKNDIVEVLSKVKVKIKTHPGEYRKWTNSAYSLINATGARETGHYRGKISCLQVQRPKNMNLISNC